MRPHPHLYEINTWVWLGELSRKYERQIGLGEVPFKEWDALASWGFDWVWLMGVWQRSEAGRLIALDDPQLRREYDRALPNWQPADVVGSPYAVQAYCPDPNIGSWKDLDVALEALHARGMKLMLDFVPNHTALDHAWVQSHPEFYVQGTAQDFERSPGDFYRVDWQDQVLYLAHGRDPYFPAWTDTVQLNYFNESARSALVQELQNIARHCDGIRCDMAMLVLNGVFRKTWGSSPEVTPCPSTEFWLQVMTNLPGLVWMAEVYWDLEWQMQQLGFHFAYDKRLYDRLRHSSAQEVSLHLSADVTYQSRLVRFLENHDEPRSAHVFSREQLPAVATLMATLPGLHLYHQGQLEGKGIRNPVQLGRQQEEPIDQEIEVMYERLLRITSADVFHLGEWSRLPVQEAGNSTADAVIAYQWKSDRDWRIVVVNLSPLSWRGHVRLQDAAKINSSSGCELVDQLTSRAYTFQQDDLSHDGLPVHLGSFGAHVFSVSVIPASG